MERDTEVQVTFTAEQLQVLLQVLTQVTVQGTPSMRLMASIEDTLLASVEEE